MSNGGEENAPPSVDDISDAATRVLQALSLHNPDSPYVPVLSQAIEELSETGEQLGAVRALHSASHIKCLGDVYLEELPGHEWPKLVSALRQASLSYLQANDPDAPTGREQGFDPGELSRRTGSPQHSAANDLAADGSERGVRAIGITTVVAALALAAILLLVNQQYYDLRVMNETGRRIDQVKVEMIKRQYSFGVMAVGSYAVIAFQKHRPKGGARVSWIDDGGEIYDAEVDLSGLIPRRYDEGVLTFTIQDDGKVAGNFFIQPDLRFE